MPAKSPTRGKSCVRNPPAGYGRAVDQYRHDQTRGVDDEGPQLLGGGPVAGESDKAIGVVGEQAAQDVTDCPANQGVCPGGFEEVHGAEVDGGTDDSHDAKQHHCPGVFVNLPVNRGLSWASSTVWLGMRYVCGVRSSRVVLLISIILLPAVVIARERSRRVDT